MSDATEYHKYGPLEIPDDLEDSVFGRHRTAKLFGLRFHWPFPISAGVHSSSATVLGYRVYGANAAKPIRFLHRHVFCRISDARYWLLYRLHPKHQYHIVRTGLRPGYHDECALVLHACMALLCRYVEDNDGPEAMEKWSAELRARPDPHAPEGMDSAQAKRQDEAVAIYRWWKTTRPADKKRRRELTHELYGKKSRMKTKPTDNPNLEEIFFDPFEGDDIAKEKELRKLEGKIDRDEQTMLHRLIKIRSSLWT